MAIISFMGYALSESYYPNILKLFSLRQTLWHVLVFFYNLLASAFLFICFAIAVLLV